MRLKIVLLLFLFVSTCFDSGRYFYDSGFTTTQELEDMIVSDPAYVYSSATATDVLVRVKHSDVLFHKNKFKKLLVTTAAYSSVFYPSQLFILYCKLLI